MALITYLKLKHLYWGLGTKDPYSDPADKTFLGLHIGSNFSKWSSLLLKWGKNFSRWLLYCKSIFYFIFKLPNGRMSFLSESYTTQSTFSIWLLMISATWLINFHMGFTQALVLSVSVVFIN